VADSCGVADFVSYGAILTRQYFFFPTHTISPSVTARWPYAALSVWVAEQQEVTQEAPADPSLLCLRHPDIQGDVWATPSREPFSDEYEAIFTRTAGWARSEA
jgi:hypothetical protein